MVLLLVLSYCVVLAVCFLGVGEGSCGGGGRGVSVDAVLVPASLENILGVGLWSLVDDDQCP